MELSFNELINYSIKLISDYDLSNHLSLDQFLDEQFKDDKYLDDADYTFIVEVFTGCVRHSKLLEVAVNGFLDTAGKNSLLKEIYTFKVFEYLVLFRLEELGIKNFLKFVTACKSKHLLNFLLFVADEARIVCNFKDNWNSIYESAYVEDNILSPFLEKVPKLLLALKSLDKNTETQRGQIQKKTTTVKPFNLTQVKPPTVIIQEPIPSVQPISFYRPIPASTYIQDPQVEKLKDLKQNNWQKAMALHSEINMLAPSCAKPSKSEKTLKKMERLAAEEDKRGCVPPIQRKYVPPSALEPVSIKLNTAAILREGRVYQKKEEEFLKKLEDLEYGGNDLRSYEERQDRLRLEDDLRREEELQMNVLLGKLSKEEAILARKKMVAENKEKADEMRVEANRLMQDYLMLKLKEDEENKLRVEKVQSTQEDMKEAKRRLIAYKSSIVQSMQEGLKQLMRIALEDAEQEMQDRLKLIREIREMESNREVFQKSLDITEVGGHGLLCEMSILELRERLKLAEERDAEMWALRNSEIHNNKQIKTQLLQDTLNKISYHRSELSKTAARKSDERKTMEAEIRPPLASAPIAQMQKRLEEMKTQRLMEEASEKAKAENNKNNSSQKPTRGNKKQTVLTNNNMSNNTCDENVYCNEPNRNVNRSDVNVKVNTSASTASNKSRVALLAL